MIKDSTYSILNDPSLLAAKEKAFERLSLYYHGGNDQKTCNLEGLVFFPDVDPYKEPERWVEAALDRMAEHAEAIRDTEFIRPLCIEMGFYGVHFIDKIFDADVFWMDDGWQVHYLSSPIGELRMPDLSANETVLLAQRVLDAFLAAKVKLPVFGLPTLASALNIALNLYGQEILVAMYTDPDAVKHDLGVINDVIIAMHKMYLKKLPLEQLQPVVSWQRTQPYGYGQLCGCSTQLLSKELYDEFVAPLDDALLGVYPNGGMIHLCGAHLQHSETFRNMKNLHAFQFHNRAAQDLQAYYENLREDQVIYVNCCPEMPYEKAFEITGGKRVIFVEAGKPKEVR